jgi:hypothetical protein
MSNNRQGGDGMKQGAARSALSERGNDLYETPDCCVTSAHHAGVFGSITFAGSHGKVWEPCAGRGRISRNLRALGYGVVAQDLVAYAGADPDIETGIDFLMEQRAPAAASCIITNPPFKLEDEFVRHGLKLVPRVAVLLRAMAIEGASRADLIDNHLTDYWIGIDRPPMFHREGWEGKKLSCSGAPFAWFCFSAEPRPRHQPINLHRFWWRPR